jgi:hypothetical protein
MQTFHMYLTHLNVIMDAIFVHFSVYLRIFFLCMIIKSQKLHMPLFLLGKY